MARPKMMAKSKMHEKKEMKHIKSMGKDLEKLHKLHEKTHMHMANMVKKHGKMYK